MLLSGWLTSYLGILALPLSDLVDGCIVLWLLGGADGPFIIVELGLSLGTGLNCMLSFKMMSDSSIVGLDGAKFGSYQDVDSWNITS